MSKRNSFGRFTAMSLAGISAISSMAIVSYAEAYPSNVYEFTYGGIAATQSFKTVVNSAAINNDYVHAANANAVFTGGFTVADLDEYFDIIKSADPTLFSSVNFDTNAWSHKDQNALTGITTVVVPSEYAEQRDGTAKSWTFYFKSKAERDSAVNAIVAANKSEYGKRLSAATSAFGNDLTKTTNNYRTDMQNKIKKMQDQVNKWFKENPNDTFAPVSYIDLDGLDTSVTTVYKSAKDKADKDADYTLNELVRKQNDLLNENVKKLNDIAAQAKSEFAEMYKASNYAFDDYKHADKDSCTVIKIDDSKTVVEFGGHTGQFIKDTEAKYTKLAGGTLDLTTSYYRTAGQYVNSESYTFTGEIIDGTLRTTASLIDAYLLDSNRWSDFSAVIQGKPSDNDNTTEPGTSNKDDKDDKDETSKKENTYYPSLSSYRVPNADSISFLGKNGYWYTSSAAAEIYGNGFTGTTQKTNYSSVKGSKTVYFNALDGRYYTSTSSSYAYVVEENSSATTTAPIQDPYYYYYLLSQNGGYINTTTKIDPSAPTIYGSSKQSGWTKILANVKSKKNGVVTIDMNEATTIPADVLKAAAANNNTIKAVNENGSIFTIKGSDIDYATAINTTVTYNVKLISDNLKNKAIKVNKGAVSTTQVVISEDGNLGADATVTVKLSSKRAGYTVKAYRVSSNGKKLTCEGKGVVKSNGQVDLDISSGGKFVLVVIK